MNWFSLLAAAAFVTLGLTAQADQPATSITNQPGVVGPPVSVLRLGTGVDTDFPGYPPGFSSYQGLGFMGSCCEQICPAAQHAWDGYSAEGCYSGANPFHGSWGGVHSWMNRPGSGYAPKSCTSCGDDKVSEPDKNAANEYTEPVPEPPTPHATGETCPEPPTPSPSDRSARRSDQRWLLNSRSDL